MRFCIVSHVIHTHKDNQIFGYAPYVNEMNLWLKYTDEVYIVAPKEEREISEIDTFYQHQNIHFIDIPNLHFKSLSRFFVSIWYSVKIIIFLFKIFSKVDHIHLRCPGNIGLLGTIVQLFFPRKNKTAKYAGNWDLKAKQPLSYVIQKWILRNSFLSKNIKVLVYGKWDNSTKNIMPFFTATYSESEKKEVLPRDFNDKIKFLFVGTLSVGKNPLYALELVQNLNLENHQVELHFLGDGVKKNDIQDRIQQESLRDCIFLRGNLNRDELKNEYQSSHFMILPSKSEGWPKAVAEAMFWGCLPISTNVSCVPFMLDYGKRGILLSGDLEYDIKQIKNLIHYATLYKKMCIDASNWSQEYTLDKFELEIKKLLQ